MSDDPERFETSRLKVQRAYRHIQELRDTFGAFLQSDFCQVAIKTDAEGYQILQVESVKNPPPEISLIIGDAIHNLRAALDHVIVRVLGEGSDKAAFPVAKDRNNPGAHSTYQAIKKALPELALLLTDQIAIHDTGQPCIWAISKLDNIDKHNLLIATVSVQVLRNFRVENETGSFLMDRSTVVLDQGGTARLMRVPLAQGKLEVTRKGEAAAQILFRKGQPLEGKPIIESLTKMAELTLQAVETIELFWFGQKREGQTVKA